MEILQPLPPQKTSFWDFRNLNELRYFLQGFFLALGLVIICSFLIAPFMSLLTSNALEGLGINITESEFFVIWLFFLAGPVAAIFIYKLIKRRYFFILGLAIGFLFFSWALTSQMG